MFKKVISTKKHHCSKDLTRILHRLYKSRNHDPIWRARNIFGLIICGKWLWPIDYGPWSKIGEFLWFSIKISTFLCWLGINIYWFVNQKLYIGSTEIFGKSKTPFNLLQKVASKAFRFQNFFKPNQENFTLINQHSKSVYFKHFVQTNKTGLVHFLLRRPLLESPD